MQHVTQFRKSTLLLIFSLALVAISYALRPSSGFSGGAALAEWLFGPGEPPVPDIMPPAEQIGFWTNRLEPDTQDYISMTHLGRAYLLLAREAGDVGSYTRAEDALRRALELNPDYAPARSLLGSVLIGRHAFAEARENAGIVLAEHPNDAQALAVAGDAALELGDYEAAKAAYDRLLELAPGGPVYSRLARLDWLHGRTDEAIDWMQEAAAEAVRLDIGGETLAWYRFQLGELYFQQGDVRSARKWYDEAAQAFPGYYLAEAGMGKAAAATGDLDRAIAVYEPLVRRLPRPEFIAFLGDLYALSGQPVAAQDQYEAMMFIQKMDASQQLPYNRQMALFLANHNIELDTALAYAESELAARQDIYAYDTLGWVLYRLGRFDEAAALSEKALALGTRDALLFYHAGMIAAARGEREEAETLLILALDLNPNYDLIQAAEARQKLLALSEQARSRQWSLLP